MLIIVSGKSKAPIVKEILTGPITPKVPAKAWLFHKECIVELGAVIGIRGWITMRSLGQEFGLRRVGRLKHKKHRKKCKFA